MDTRPVTDAALDAEAAEVVARVEGTGWRAGVRVL